MYPALAAVQSLIQQCAEANIAPEILWVGSVDGMEQELVERAGLKIEAISAAGLRGKNPFVATKGLVSLVRGYRQSQVLIQQFQPDILFITGGYVCVPVTFAAQRADVPIIIYLPDMEPGMAIKYLAKFASRVAVTTAESCQHFAPDLAVVTGYPVRPELQAGPPDRAKKLAAKQQLELDETLPTLLIFGGSRGARSINQAVTHQIEAYLAVCQVVHITGKLDIEWIQTRRAELPKALQARYHVSAYLHEAMIEALFAADLVISRAGAGILGEYPAIGLPSVLVPLPIAGGHQWLNAHYLAHNKAAVTVDNANLQTELKDITLNLITDKNRLQIMSTAATSLAKPHAAVHLAQEILEVKNHGN